MHRRRMVSVILSLLLLGLVGTSAIGAGVRAQEATPPPEEFEIIPGVVAFDAIGVAGEEPVAYRIRFDPAVSYSFGESPTLELVYLQTGTLTLRVNVPLTVHRTGVGGSPGEPVTTQADVDILLTAGDYFVLPPFVMGEVRNDGAVPAVVSVAAITPDLETDAPLVLATPVATPVAATPIAATPEA